MEKHQLTAAHRELMRLLRHGADNAKDNSALRAELAEFGYPLKDYELRALIHELRLNAACREVLCASNAGYFYAVDRAEAERYCEELHRRNASQLRMESAVRYKTYARFIQADAFINHALLEGIGFHAVSPRQWYCPVTGITIKKSTDEEKYPNHYGIFHSGNEKPTIVVTDCGGLFAALCGAD